MSPAPVPADPPGGRRARDGADPGQVRRVRVRVAGVVQGVGYRPFVHRVANELGLAGHVGNDAEGVFVEASGPPGAVASLLRRLRDDAPALAVVERIEVVEWPPPDGPPPDGPPPARLLRGGTSAPLPRGADVRQGSGRDPRGSGHDPRGSGRDPRGDGRDVGDRTEVAGFRIVPSPGGEATGPATSIPPDTAVCDACLAELRDPADRRFGYPFIACTHCGPRFTITTGLPYDRASTTMVDFPLCGRCLAEYEDPGSRRFHAQPTACPDCGPRLSMPVPDVVGHLIAGRIVAIKGVGGYHLTCDASDADAVGRLRARKQRGDKPFAVMVRDLAAARRIGIIDDEAAALLASPARPIVLADSRDPALQARIAPGNSFVGVLLPYAPLHHLLFDAGAPAVLVMTSGNLADEPICIDADDAEARLGGIADAFCHHDRRIHVPCDDSVVRIVAGATQPVRRSRGYAPLPVALPLEAPPVAAVGGELKATAAVASGRRAWLSQHIGDTEHLETLDVLARSVETLAALQQVTPTAMLSDAHPGYLSHGWARDRAAELGVPHLVVQHHHAHLASLLAERGVPPDEPVLGVVLDGTGYGVDATIWGGELLLGSYAAVQRVGHLRPVLLPGGDAAVRHPARTAVAHLTAAGLPVDGTASAAAIGEADLRLLGRMLATGSHCVPTTSAGRLFDAIASLLGVRHAVDYEAQAAIELEALAARAAPAPPAFAPPTHVRCAAPVSERTPAEQTRGGGGERGEEGGERGGDPWGLGRARDAEPGVPPLALDPRPWIVAAPPLVLDPRPWIVAAAADHAAGRPVEQSARAFHVALADGIAAAVRDLRSTHGFATVGLSGGVFANAVLTELCLDRLDGLGVAVLTHHLVPPNDGGLALGQVAVAAAGGAHPQSA